MKSWRDPILEEFSPRVSRLTVASDPDGLLQQRWPIFLDRRTSDDRRIRDAVPEETESLRVPGPMAIPFEHPDVRVYIDNLFLEDILQPVAHPAADRLAGSWEVAGIRRDADVDLRRRLEELLTVVEPSVPDSAAPHHAWLTFARRWAHANALVFSRKGGSVAEDLLSRYRAVRDRIDAAFAARIYERFGTLHNQPPPPPVMTRHVPRMLARTLEESGDAKVAMVLIDGLSLDQWATVRGVLADQRPSLRFGEDTLFAWIPTLTMVSWQACFSGGPPLYFPAYILNTTGHEPSAWQRFWLDEGYPRERSITSRISALVRAWSMSSSLCSTPDPRPRVGRRLRSTGSCTT